MTITLIKTKYGPTAPERWIPKTIQDALLMQHCIGAELESLNYSGLQHVTTVALAHGWNIFVTDDN